MLAYYVPVTLITLMSAALSLLVFNLVCEGCSLAFIVSLKLANCCSLLSVNFVSRFANLTS